MQLESLGADAGVFGAFQTYAAQGLVLARVALLLRDHYSLYSEAGELDAEPSGALWYRAPSRASMPVTGDWVAARVVGESEAIVEAVLPRRTCFSRRAAGPREEEQPLAANIDLVFLVCGLDGDFNLRRLERYLTLTAASGAAAVVVLNKADLCAEEGAELDLRLRQTAAVAGAAPVVACSARDAGGLDALLPFFQRGPEGAPEGFPLGAAERAPTVALLGSSGVGKSTIVNRLLGEERMRTGEVRGPSGGGRHTTTHRELAPLPEPWGPGALIDTPGMRELQLWAGRESVDSVFEDIGALAARCRYRDCSHSGEPGCAVAEALAAGALDRQRWESSHKLRAEAQRHERLSDPLAAQEQKRKLKRMHQAAKQLYRFR